MWALFEFTTMFTTNTLPSAAGTERGAWRLLGGWSGCGETRPLPLPQIRMRPEAPGYIGPESLAFREWIASGWAGVMIGLRFRSWLSSWRRGLCGLLSRRHLRTTGSSCRTRALWQEVSHCLERVLRSGEEFSKSLNHRLWGSLVSQGRGPYPHP